jgi:hypothetical protein
MCCSRWLICSPDTPARLWSVRVWKRAPDGRILIDVLGYQRWVEYPKAAAASHSRGLEGKKTSLPLQMDLALKREKEIKSNAKTKS